jgi:hypothetical protein
MKSPYHTQKEISMRKSVLLVAVVICAVFFMLGCNMGPSSDNPLVGTWNLTSQIVTHADSTSDTTFASAYYSNTYVFGEDNALGIAAVIWGIPVSASGTWDATEDSVTFTISSGGSQTWAYVISGSTLTMTRSEPEGNGVETTVEVYAKQ